MRTTQSGFTMLEILVVIGLVLMLSTVTLLVSFDTYRGSNFRNDRDLLLATLERARAQSINNLCVGSTCNVVQNSRPHGVAIRPNGQPNSYVVFQGASYATALRTIFLADSTSPQDCNAEAYTLWIPLCRRAIAKAFWASIKSSAVTPPSFDEQYKLRKVGNPSSSR